MKASSLFNYIESTGLEFFESTGLEYSREGWGNKLHG
jgi:hypothetical protein